MKRVRSKLRWFTFIVVVLAGVNSYFNGSIAESGGINVTGLGGAFATAFFVFLAILIFLSLPFNVLALIVVHSKRYPLQDFQRVSRVLTWFIGIIALLLGIYCYFAGITAGTLKVTGIGGVIYAIIFVVITLGILVAVPTHVVAFIVCSIRGPKKEPGILPPLPPNQSEVLDIPHWPEEEKRILQELEDAISPATKSPSETPTKGSGEKFAEQLIRWADAGLLVGALTRIIIDVFSAPEEEAHDEAIKFTEDVMRVRKLIKSSHRLTSHNNFPDTRTKEEKEREDAIELTKKVAEMMIQLWQKYQRLQQKQKENS